jgi:hypothetical protein
MEDARREEIEHRLLAMRATALGLRSGESWLPLASAGRPASGADSDALWRFSDYAPITIVCGLLSSRLRANPSYTDPRSPDYIELYSYADLDALVELYGHVRAVNPRCDVRFLPSSLVTKNDLMTHLVLLGGVDWNQFMPEVLDALNVPVTQLTRDVENDVGAFEVREGERTLTFRPTIRTETGRRELIEDVSHFCRGPNPYNQMKTVTVCNGMFGRGTYGAARALTDIEFRDRNTAHVRTQFPVGRTFSILARIKVVVGEVVTPDWTRPETVLHEWCEAGG